MSIESTTSSGALLPHQLSNKRTGRALGNEATVFRMMVDHLSMNIAMLEVDEEKTFPIVAVNGVGLAQYPTQELLGHSLFEIIPKPLHAQLKERLLHCCTTREQTKYELSNTLSNGQILWFEQALNPIIDETGAVTHLVTIVSNITDRKQQELRLQEALNELSTPLLSISDTTVVLPLIGSIDSQRIQQLISSLLEGVAKRRAEQVIIDITGVPIVDTQVANALIQATQAVRLLGARVVLSGIRPEVAQTLVGLGLDFSMLSPQATLQSAIALILQREA
jgi:PAS domain S-box